ncbi:hypothetical protein ACFYO1_34740 [Nocardia sp. NPDC006044]|uniref:hypothetical protein n=1 Tax=Nocardia sp. NPDC006044 TaxID=3364306 RepID=UPI0036BE0E0E
MIAVLDYRVQTITACLLGLTVAAFLARASAASGAGDETDPRSSRRKQSYHRRGTKHVRVETADVPYGFDEEEVEAGDPGDGSVPNQAATVPLS